MPDDNILVGSEKPVAVTATAASNIRVSNGRGGTIYYKNEANVSKLVNDGSLVAGESKIFTTPHWFISDSGAWMFVEHIPNQGTDMATQEELDARVPATVIIKPAGESGGVLASNDSAVALLESGKLKESELPSSVVSSSSVPAKATGVPWAVNVKDGVYGAKGDGIADDTAGIKAAAKVAEAGSGILYFPPGTYLYTEMPELKGSKRHLLGAGMGLTILKPEGCKALRMHGTDWTVRDLEIDGSSGGEGLTWGEGFHSLIDRVSVHGCTGSGLKPDDTGSFNQLIFRDVVSQNNTGNGIRTKTEIASGGNNCEFYSCRCSGNQEYGLYAPNTCIRVYGGWYASNYLMGIKLGGIGFKLYAPLVENNWQSRNYPRKNETAYALGARTKSTDTVTNPYVFMCLQAGISGGAEPAWPIKVGEEVTDGTCKWMNVGGSGEGNGDGAGIDDTGSNRGMAWRAEANAQPLLNTGNDVEIYEESGSGGSLSVAVGRSGFGRIGGVKLASSTTAGVSGSISPIGEGALQAGIFRITSALRHVGTKLAFFSALEKEQQTVTGAKKAGASASVLAALATYGLVKDESSAGSETIASTATIAPKDGVTLVKVTGVTGITKITKTSDGHCVTLKFAEALTVSDGENLKLNGNFEATADDTLTLVCDGTNWFEVGRSAN